MKMNNFFKNMVFFWLILLSVNMPGQSAKKYFQAGEDFFKAKNYSDAVAQFTKAIEIKPQYDDAYQKRAEAYEFLLKYNDAADDYIRLSAIDTKNSDVYANIGRLYILLGKNNDALSALNKATYLKKGNVKAYQSKVLALLNLEKYYDALKVSDSALEIDKNAQNYYNHGLVMQKLNTYPKAEEDFKKSIREDKKFVIGYVALANTQVELNKLDDATKNCESALKFDPNCIDALLVRSKIFIKKVDYSSAINDISKIIVMAPGKEEYYLLRGEYYQSFKQNQNAINDYSKVISINPQNADAYYKRASSYEEVADYKSAIKDYIMLTKFSDDDVKAKKLLQASRERLFVLNKETNPPELNIENPIVKHESEIEMPLDKKEITLKGTVTDQSDIKYLKVNGINIVPVKHDNTNEFTVSVSIDSTNTLVVATSDVYDNVTEKTFKVKRTEVNPPKVSIIAPIASDNGEIYLSSNDPTLYIEGGISDESQIKSVIIDGVLASFKMDELNPKFSANISVMNKDKFTVIAEDIYGNKSEKVFKFNREGIAMHEDNPMGRTWAVFIENADYKTFASLEGPPKDVTLMREAFSNYKINNVIVKKNMTKEQMDKFFSIELRDLVRSNKVNSLLVWYAGHGKYINDAGYWIPVDANRDDEFSYFNINSLKASLLDYSKIVTHVLVVTDACESGPSFYQAMRSAPAEKNCGDWQATKFKSSQVFSSAGYELAVDNSQFTKTFANALRNNPDKCIPIENIVSKVTLAVAKSKQQKPKFGKIFGLEDEDGTFFFIK